MKNESQHYPMKDRQGPPEVSPARDGGVSLKLNLGDMLSKSIYGALLDKVGEKVFWQAIEAAMAAEAEARPLEPTREWEAEYRERYNQAFQGAATMHYLEKRRLREDFDREWDLKNLPYREKYFTEFRVELQKRLLVKCLELPRGVTVDGLGYLALMLVTYYGGSLSAMRPLGGN